ncbi:MAG: hypothetical protein ACJZ8W_02140 [Limisphaerales bacterium]
MKPLILLELNEVNFGWVEKYSIKDELPEFHRLFSNYKVCRTTSEVEYEKCEPWIQWVSAHSGKTFDEHGIFRLGDIVNSGVEQIWKTLEKRNISVGAVAPMNAENDLRNPAFFIPDPWTNTPVSGSRLAKALCEGVKQIVNANAGGTVGLQSYVKLAAGAVRYARLRNLAAYLSLSLGSVGRPWRKALFLDRLLADLFISKQKRHTPEFSTLFLNAGAHIQHHYLFNSSVYNGKHSNPPWYVKDGDDPVLEAYKTYDQIIGDVRSAFPWARLMILTGLHQDPYTEISFYWRLRDHAKFLREVGVPFSSVEPRMSRDFLIWTDSEAEASQAEQALREARLGASDLPVFTTDNRGKSLFITLTWPKDVSAEMPLKINGRKINNFRESLAFVAIKNGHHNPEGYIIDTEATSETEQFPIEKVHTRILEHFEA